MNERFFGLCLEKLKEKQEELGKLIEEEEKEYSPMKEALREKGLIPEGDQENDFIYELHVVTFFAVKELNCSYVEAWNADYIDLYEALIFKIENGGDE